MGFIGNQKEALDSKQLETAVQEVAKRAERVRLATKKVIKVLCSKLQRDDCDVVFTPQENEQESAKGCGSNSR